MKIQIPDEFSHIREMPVSYIWRGHGSALFIEFGKLHPRVKRDGTEGSPEGEMSLMIEWSWRIEQGVKVLTGSFSEDQQQQEVFPLLLKAKVYNIYILGRIPEINIELSNSINIVSFMTADGDPAWTLFDQTKIPNRWLYGANGMPCVSLKDG